jgi:hypothetical protein
MSVTESADQWYADIDTWKISVANLLDYREAWREHDWGQFLAQTQRLLRMVLEAQPDIDPKPIAELIDMDTLQRGPRSDLVLAFHRAVRIFEASVKSLREPNLPAMEGIAKQNKGKDQIRLTPGIRDILHTLAKSKERLTREQLVEAMGRAKRARGKSFVANAMPKLRHAGLVDNRQDCDPNGYAITEAGRRRL